MSAADVVSISHQFPWVEQVEDSLVELEDEGVIEVYDDGEEHGDAYIFFNVGQTEVGLLAASR